MYEDLILWICEFSSNLFVYVGNMDQNIHKLFFSQRSINKLQILKDTQSTEKRQSNLQVEEKIQGYYRTKYNSTTKL